MTSENRVKGMENSGPLGLKSLPDTKTSEQKRAQGDPALTQGQMGDHLAPLVSIIIPGDMCPRAPAKEHKGPAQGDGDI